MAITGARGRTDVLQGQQRYSKVARMHQLSLPEAVIHHASVPHSGDVRAWWSSFLRAATTYSPPTRIDHQLEYAQGEGPGWRRVGRGVGHIWLSR